MLVLIMAALTLSCSLPKSKSNPVYYYTLENNPLDLSLGEQLPFVVRVERFTASPPFNTQRIVYGDKGLHRNYYANFKWIADPGDLLSYNLCRDIQQSNGFKAALCPGTSSQATHTIYGWVEEFLEEDYHNPAQASVRVNISLIDAREGDPIQRILLQKSYSGKAPCDEKTPDALSRAMSIAAAKMNAEIIQDLYNRFRQ